MGSHPALVRAIRGDLDWITMRALEKDPLDEAIRRVVSRAVLDA